MPAKDHTVWDIVSDNPLRWWPSEARRRRNAAARTAFLDDPETTLSPDRLHTTVKARLKSGVKVRSRVHWIYCTGSAVSFVGLGTFQLSLLLVGLRPPGIPTWVLFTPALYFLLGVWMGAFARTAFLKSRSWRRALADHCPDCNYDLSASHADPPLDPESLGINLGPRHCPECGALWPLVPPETPPRR